MVVPGVVQVGQTTLAVGFHVDPMDLEVVIEYSEHFTLEGEACDTAGTVGATQAAVAPTWVTLNACTVGEGYVRLVDSATGDVIKDVSVTVDPAGAPRQQAVSVTISGVASAELVPGGSGDRFSVSAAGLEAHREHNLHTVVLTTSAAFNRGCTTFGESHSIVGLTSSTANYSVYGCVAPSALIWSWVEDVGGTSLGSTGALDNPVDIADPKVSFGDDEYSVDEEDEDGVTVTVELSHPSSNNIEIPIDFAGTAERTDDYVVEGLSSDDTLTFSHLSTSEEFTIVPNDDDDFVNETVNLSFGTLPSTVMGTESPSSATVTIDDDDENSDPYITTRISPVSFDECGEGTVAVYSATDPDGHPLTWSLQSSSSHPDRGDFDLEDDELSDDGILTFDNVPDFEDPDDSDGNNEYKIMIRVRDDYRGSDERNVTVNVTNLKPTIDPGQGSKDYAEGRTIRVARFRASDPCGGDIAWSRPVTNHATDRDAFEITDDGDLTFVTSPDFENPHDSNRRNDYRITVMASDGNLPASLSDSIDVTVTVTDVNESPVITGPRPPMVSYDENRTDAVAMFIADDPENDDITWSLRGIDSAAFRIFDSGELTFKTPPDFENPLDSGGDNEYNITVLASDTDDGTGLSAELNVTISVTNLPPTITSGAHWIDYDEGDTVSAADYVASDPGGGDISWSLHGIDAGDFRISQTGVLTFDSTPDFENPLDSGGDNEYNITVRASDTDDGSGLSAERTVTVSVVNLPPTITSGPHWVDYDEGDTVSAAEYVASDPGGGTIFWSLRGIDAGDFRISQNGVLWFDSTPDFENPLDDDPDNDYEITVRASDASGTTAIMNVTVRVIDVNERPEKKSDIPDQMMTASVFRIISLQGTFSDPDGDTLTYSASTSASGIATASVNNRDSTLTIAALAAGMATITVTAADRSSTDADRLTISQNFTVTVEAPIPTVTIARHMNTPATVTEGGQIRFTLTASSAPTADLTVNVTVTETDPLLAGRISDFVTGTIPDDLIIALGTTTSDLILDTEDDTLDESDVGALARVEVGAGYTVGPPSVAVVTIEDNDVPPGAPTGLRANGDLDSSGNVTLRWNSVAGATGYMVRYTDEDCDSDGVCNPDDGSWVTRTYTAGTTGTVIEADLGGLSEEQLYRVQVQTVIVDASGWSDFTLVFPTDSPLGHGTDVATAPFHGYQAKNAQGSHEFRYVLCAETVPTGVTMTAQDMNDAVDKWEDAVTWDRNGTNIITTSAYSLPSDESCHTVVPLPRGRFEVKFASDRKIGNACGQIFPWQNTAPACWRSSSWERIGVGLIKSGSILLNSGRGAEYWNENLASGCRKLHEIIVHEVGHGFGIGNAAGVDYNRHPINTTHSIMSYDDPGRYCGPQAYDIVALMALYQSR